MGDTAKGGYRSKGFPGRVFEGSRGVYSGGSGVELRSEKEEEEEGRGSV